MLLWAWQGPHGDVVSLAGDDGLDELGVEGAVGMTAYEAVSRDVPGGSGTMVDRMRPRPRTVVVPLIVQDQQRNSDALDNRLAQLADELAPEDGPGQLLATRADPNGRPYLDSRTQRPLTRALRCVYTGGLELSRSWGEQYGGWYQLAGLSFLADRPYWTNLDPARRVFGASTPVPWFPILPLRLGSDSLLGDSVEVNDGAIPAYPVWTIDQPGDRFTATNVTTGEAFTVDTRASGGQALTVDTRPSWLGGGRTVRRADGTSMYEALGGPLWALTRGRNDLTLAVDGGTPGATRVTLTYAPEYRTALAPVLL